MNLDSVAIAVVIPCYRVSRHVLDVIGRIGPICSRVYVVDDCCPEKTGDVVLQACKDPRVTVIRHNQNQGVGGAMVTGYQRAVGDGADVIVKVDGDGQMDPALLMTLAMPVILGEADYAKGNRFFDLRHIRQMPTVRIVGNAVLSLLSKLSTGYWHIFDPTNGYTAISSDVVRRLPLEQISRRYFFESDMLFQLNTIRAVVVDVPMDATYGDEVSGLRIRQILGEFLLNHACNTVKRVFYNYFLRDFSIASLELVTGLALLTFGVSYGSYHWIVSAQAGATTPAGTVILAALPIILGIQLLLAFFAFDIAASPTRPIHRLHRWASTRGVREANALKHVRGAQR
jgi:dolichol-phosphate mannosyltransferase